MRILKIYSANSPEFDAAWVAAGTGEDLDPAVISYMKNPDSESAANSILGWWLSNKHPLLPKTLTELASIPDMSETTISAIYSYMDYLDGGQFSEKDWCILMRAILNNPATPEELVSGFTWDQPRLKRIIASMEDWKRDDGRLIAIILGAPHVASHLKQYIRNNIIPTKQRREMETEDLLESFLGEEDEYLSLGSTHDTTTRYNGNYDKGRNLLQQGQEVRRKNDRVSPDSSEAL